ncbi:MAG: hypothetical protein AAFY56_07150 [Pseudomonadota bacterium]
MNEPEQEIIPPRKGPFQQRYTVRRQGPLGFLGSILIGAIALAVLIGLVVLGLFTFTVLLWGGLAIFAVLFVMQGLRRLFGGSDATPPSQR